MEQVRQQAFLDGGIPTQGLVVQDEQEAVELHQELVQHCKKAQTNAVSGGRIFLILNGYNKISHFGL